MEPLNENWTISEVEVPCETSGRQRTEGSKQKKRSGQRTRRKKTKKVLIYKRLHFGTPNSKLVLVGLLFFVLAIGNLLQHSVISSLNDDVRTLQAELDEKIAMNDSKSGELIENSDWAGIEATARSYGMQELSPSQYAYESGLKDQQEVPDQKEKDSWWSSIFK